MRKTHTSGFPRAAKLWYRAWTILVILVYLLSLPGASRAYEHSFHANPVRHKDVSLTTQSREIAAGLKYVASQPASSFCVRQEDQNSIDNSMFHAALIELRPALLFAANEDGSVCQCQGDTVTKVLDGVGGEPGTFHATAVVTAPPVVSENPPTELFDEYDEIWIKYATVRDTLKERMDSASNLVKQLKKQGKTTKDKELVDAFYEFLAAEADLESLRNCMLLTAIDTLQGNKELIKQSFGYLFCGLMWGGLFDNMKKQTPPKVHPIPNMEMPHFEPGLGKH